MADFEFEEPTDWCPTAMIHGSKNAIPSDVDAALIEKLFRKHGAILLRGFHLDVANFRAFADRLCSTSVFNESPGRALLDRDANIQTVNLGADAFPLHPELSRTPWKPDACLFACLEAPVEGGETTICDGIDIVNHLPNPLVEVMRERQLLYIRPADPDVLDFWIGTSEPTDEQLALPPTDCPFWFRRVGERVLHGFARPLLHRPMFDDRLAFGNFLLFARDYLRLENFPVLDDGRSVPATWLDAVRNVAEQLTYAVTWQEGDVIVLDNTRFMHGRRPISDPRHRCIATYFGYVSFAKPGPEEPENAIWRRELFRPPVAARN